MIWTLAQTHDVTGANGFEGLGFFPTSPGSFSWWLPWSQITMELVIWCGALALSGKNNHKQGRQPMIMEQTGFLSNPDILARVQAFHILAEGVWRT